MSLLVKVCGLTDAAHAAAACDAGADALGFVFAASPRRVTPPQAVRIAAGLPAGVRRVAVMLHPTAAEWAAVLDGFAPDVLQTDAADFDSLDVPASIERWPVYREGGPVVEGRGPGDLAGTFVYEGARSGSGQTVDWTEARACARGGRMILAGGLNPGNVAEAVRQVRPWGVDASSGVEAAPGRKDPARIAAFVAAARAAAEQNRTTPDDDHE